MQVAVLEFLKTQRIGVLAIAMPDGTPHGSTLHFACVEKPLSFVFLSAPDSEKIETLKKAPTPASFVVGVNEEVMKTVQMRGVAQLADTESIRRAYFETFPEKLNKHPDSIFFTFIPTWWRFTDWTHPEGKKIYTSD